jgi:predicted ester cyclase
LSEDNKLIVYRAIEEVYNKGNLEAVKEIYAPDYVFHWSFGPKVHGSKAVKDMVNRRRAVMPNVTMIVEDQIAEGDKVVTRWTVRDTRQGEVKSAPPDGDQVTMTGILIDRVAGHKIQESWGEEAWDVMGIRVAMGIRIVN